MLPNMDHMEFRLNSIPGMVGLVMEEHMECTEEHQSMDPKFYLLTRVMLVRFPVNNLVTGNLLNNLVLTGNLNNLVLTVWYSLQSCNSLQNGRDTKPKLQRTIFKSSVLGEVLQGDKEQFRLDREQVVSRQGMMGRGVV